MPYAFVFVVVAVALLVVAGPALVFSRTRVIVYVDGDARGIQIDARRFLAPTRRYAARFERTRPRVVPAERMQTALIISDDDQDLSLDDVPPVELERLRSRLVGALASWEPLPSAPVVEVSAEDNDREMARGLVVAMLFGDLERAKVWLSSGADPDGHPEAGGRGAPLFIAKLRGDVRAESLLRARRATIMEVDSTGLRVLEVLAEASGSSELADMLAQRRQ